MNAQNTGQGIDWILNIRKVFEDKFYFLLAEVFMLPLVIYLCMVIYSFSQEFLPYVQPLLKVNFKKAGVLKWLMFQKQKINRNWTGTPDTLPIILPNQTFFCCVGVWWCPPQWFTSFILYSVCFSWLSPVRGKQTLLMYITYLLLPEWDKLSF